MKSILFIPDDTLLYIVKYLNFDEIEKFYLSIPKSQKKNLINLLNLNKFNFGEIMILFNLLCVGTKLNFFRLNLIKFELNELCIMDSDAKLSSIIHTPIKIQKLVLNSSKILEEDLIDLLSTNITSLDIKYCIDITDNIFYIIGQKCSCLEKINICVDFIVYLKNIIYIFQKCLKLEFIMLNKLFIDDDLKKVINNDCCSIYITIYRKDIMH